MSSSGEITRLLGEWKAGNPGARDQLIPLVYRELRQLADSYLRGEQPGHTLQPTALVHEAYLRLAGQKVPDWQNRSHFFGVAAHLMRQILVDHARTHRAAKRGGARQRVTLQDSLLMSRDRTTDLIALGDALSALAEFDSRKCTVVELHFFGGLTAEETARALGISAVTVRRDLRLAEAWLFREMKKR